MKILGIDPGFGRIGYGVVEWQKGRWQHVAHGCIETSAKDSFPIRLMEIHHELQTLVRKYKPNGVGIEKLFFAKNLKTAVDVGQARGVIVLTLSEAKLPIYECTPLQVKQSITGYGKAEKKQIQTMVNYILQLPQKSIQDDAADALAIALTVANMNSLQKRG
jgi:crossover junction endodeoxyribonuclease RuvC